MSSAESMLQSIIASWIECEIRLRELAEQKVSFWDTGGRAKRAERIKHYTNQRNAMQQLMIDMIIEDPELKKSVRKLL